MFRFVIPNQKWPDGGKNPPHGEDLTPYQHLPCVPYCIWTWRCYAHWILFDWLFIVLFDFVYLCYSQPKVDRWRQESSSPPTGGRPVCLIAFGAGVIKPIEFDLFDCFDSIWFCTLLFFLMKIGLMTPDFCKPPTGGHPLCQYCTWTLRPILRLYLYW